MYWAVHWEKMIEETVEVEKKKVFTTMQKGWACYSSF